MIIASITNTTCLSTTKSDQSIFYYIRFFLSRFINHIIIKRDIIIKRNIICLFIVTIRKMVTMMITKV